MKYYEYMQELDDKSLKVGLLKHGLFNNKLPPIFTSESYYNYICEKEAGGSIPFAEDGNWKGWIKYDNNRNSNLPRTLGVPNPFAHYFLCKEIIENWQTITDYFKGKTDNGSFKRSQIHIRKMRGKEQIFEMNYSAGASYELSLQKHAIDCAYAVKTDIAKCFDSIYSHSVPWALMGKETAKKQRRVKLRYENRLDTLLGYEKRGETHGILTGPLTSNIISEIILCAVDAELIKQEYKFVRYIDDYCCYVRSIDEGNKFVNDLRLELRKYDLSINESKTTILPIYEHERGDFPDKIQAIVNVLERKREISYKSISSLFKMVYDLFVESGKNASIFHYLFKVLAKMSSHFSLDASNFYIDKTMNLCVSFPYLLPYAQEYVFTIFGITKNIETFCRTLYDKGWDENNYEKKFYSLFFGIIHDTDFIDEKDELVSRAKEIDDCMFKLISWKYLTHFKYSAGVKEIKKMAKEYSESEDGFDDYWLFVYETLKANDLKGDWKKLKMAGVSFIYEKALKPRTYWREYFALT